MTVYDERLIESLERQLAEATSEEEIALIEKKLNALRPQSQ